MTVCTTQFINGLSLESFKEFIDDYNPECLLLNEDVQPKQPAS